MTKDPTLIFHICQRVTGATHTSSRKLGAGTEEVEDPVFVLSYLQKEGWLFSSWGLAHRKTDQALVRLVGHQRATLSLQVVEQRQQVLLEHPWLGALPLKVLALLELYLPWGWVLDLLQVVHHDFLQERPRVLVPDEMEVQMNLQEVSAPPAQPQRRLLPMLDPE